MSVNVTLLHRPVYSVVTAAEILEVSAPTLRRWLEGGPGRSQPLIRVEPTGSEEVTWGEFVEAALLCQYRKKERVPLSEIRKFIAKLRDQEGVLYPLAHSKPWIGAGRQLVVEIQDELGLPDELWLIAYTSGQLVLAPAAKEFYERVDWENDLAIAWRPHGDKESPVRCRPTYRFGHPAIKGISTAVIWEHIDGGEEDADVADQFGLSVEDVRWACNYEMSRHARQAA